MKELVHFTELARRSYDLAAHRYHEMFKDELEEKPYDRLLLDRYAALLPPSSLVCDLGCGPCGHVARHLQERGHRVIGADISGECVAIAARENPGLEFVRMDMADLGLADDSLDGIVSYYSVIHAPRRFVARFFQEFRRVLKPRGKLLVSVKAGENEGCQDELLGFQTPIYFAHFRQDEIESYLVDDGFRVLALESRPPYENEIPVARIYAIGEKGPSGPAG